jgi:N-acetylmuramoyl-L-alanine amidase
MSYKIINMFVPQSKICIKAPYPMRPTSITVHNTANTASARNEAAYMLRNNNYTSYHVVVDDIEAIQCIPFNRNAWHTGDGASVGSGNRSSIGIEIAYSNDNGFKGHKSSKYIKAEDNAATYIAHVLKQYGWGIDRVKKHEDWSGKYCPHKMLSTNTWDDFLRLIQSKLDELNGKKKKVKKVVKRKATVKAVKNQWRINKHGTQYLLTEGKWKVGSTRILTRFYSPFRSATSGGYANPGTVIHYDEIVRQDGHIWLGYKNHKNIRKYIPVKTWNSRTGSVGTDWGSWL